MKQLRLLMRLGDLGVEHVMNDGKHLYFFARGGTPPVLPEDVRAEVEEHRAWLVARTRRLSANELKQLS